MTLENCERLLAHFEAKGMEKEADEMRKKLERKRSLPKYAHLKNSAEVSDGKKPKR